MRGRRAATVRRHGVSAALIAIAALIASCEGDAPVAIEKRAEAIVNGTEHPGDPAVVYLTYGNGASCTGTLIAPRVVLTANHCINGGSITDLKIGVGASDRPGVGQICSSVCAIRTTGNSNESSDIALLLLADDATVQCGLTPYEWVSEAPANAQTEDAVTGIGYGKTDWNAWDSAGIKRSANDAILEITDGYLRAGSLACYGDSGGPLLWNGKVWGVASQLYGQITSSGLTLCSQASSIYTRTDVHAALINSAIADSQNLDCSVCTALWESGAVCGGASGHVLRYCDSFGNVQELDCESIGDLSCDNESRTCVGGPPIPSPECGDNRDVGIKCDGRVLTWCDADGIAHVEDCGDGQKCDTHPAPHCSPADPYEQGYACNDDGTLRYCDENGHFGDKPCPEGQTCQVDACAQGAACCPPGPDEECGSLYNVTLGCEDGNKVKRCDHYGHVERIDCGDRACERHDDDSGPAWRCSPDPRCEDKHNQGLECNEDNLTYCDEHGVVRTFECEGRCLYGDDLLPYCGASNQCQNPDGSVDTNKNVECNLGNKLWYCDAEGIFRDWSCGSDYVCEVGTCQPGPACCPTPADPDCVDGAGDTMRSVGLDCEVDYLRYCDENGHVQGMTCPPDSPCVDDENGARCVPNPPLAACWPWVSPECIDEDGRVMRSVGLECEEDNLRYCDENGIVSSVDCNNGNSCVYDSCQAGPWCCTDPSDECIDGDGNVLRNVGLECEEDNLRYCDENGVVSSVDCGDGTVCVYDDCQPGPWCCDAPADPCATTCDDGDACTADSCDGATGCVFTSIDVDDGDACTVDSCDSVNGVSHEPVDSDDGDACTTDSCDSVNGVSHETIDPSDGDACTTDSCDSVNGVSHEAVSCDDGSECTADSCDPSGGCSNTSTDDDGDGICGFGEWCPFDASNDADGDGVCGDVDVCPNDWSNDTDGDGQCADVDPCPWDAANDEDGDGICSSSDTCPHDASNDSDWDGQCGDVDPCPNDWMNDWDGDGTCSGVDACPWDAANDEDGDGICSSYDACPYDPSNDADWDGLCGNVDPCPYDWWNDADYDGTCSSVDACPWDAANDEDGDGICSSYDSCPFDPSNDSDWDGICGDVDPCPNDSWNDADGDGTCSSVDPCPWDAANDGDGDGICTIYDWCPNDPYNDSDWDGICGDVDPCPNDSWNDPDSDGWCSSSDPCPYDAANDTDGDGVCESSDRCPGAYDGADSDWDGTPDGCDTCPYGGTDYDGDGSCEASPPADDGGTEAGTDYPDGGTEAGSPGGMPYAYRAW